MSKRYDLAQARFTLRTIHELRMTLAQAKGYIRTVSAERGDSGDVIVLAIEDCLAELDALRELTLANHEAKGTPNV